MARKRRAHDANVITFLTGDNSAFWLLLGMIIGYVLGIASRQVTEYTESTNGGG